MIEAEAAFRQVPAIMGRSAIRLCKIVIELVRAVNSIIRVFADLSAVARAAQSQVHVAPATVNEGSLSIPGTLAQDADYAVHGIGAPDRRPRAANHFDPVHIVEEHLLGIPIDPENKGEYTVRPSIVTSSLLANWELKPRAEIAQLPESIAATCRPGTSRNASATVVAPERRRSSLLKTKMAAAASLRFSSFPETEVTLTLTRSSREKSASELVEGEPVSAAPRRNVMSSVNPATVAVLQNRLNQFATSACLRSAPDEGGPQFHGVAEFLSRPVAPWVIVGWGALLASSNSRTLCARVVGVYGLDRNSTPASSTP